jgi:hypothetical protein
MSLCGIILPICADVVSVCGPCIMMYTSQGQSGWLCGIVLLICTGFFHPACGAFTRICPLQGDRPSYCLMHDIHKVVPVESHSFLFRVVAQKGHASCSGLLLLWVLDSALLTAAMHSAGIPAWGPCCCTTCGIIVCAAHIRVWCDLPCSDLRGLYSLQST